jgi:competence protein ComEC
MGQVLRKLLAALFRVSQTAVLVCWVVLSLILSPSLSAQSKTLDIYWIDVEGGAATLIVTPTGESILIDPGQDLERDVSRIHHVASQVAGLKSIDHFVATHWHADHYGGAMKLSERIPIGKFYDRGRFLPNCQRGPEVRNADGKLPMASYQRMTQGKAQALRPGVQLPLKQPLDKTPLSVGLASSGEVIQAGKSANLLCVGKQPVSKDRTDNAHSVVMKLVYGRVCFFDGGDLTLAMEEMLVCPVGRVGHVDLMQIDHHGLDLRNNPVLIGSLKPRAVVVNNGPDKRAETRTMQTLKSVRGIEGIWQVRRNLAAGTDGNTDPKRIANQNADCKAEYIKASVEPTGKFTIQIGSQSTRQSYTAP